MILGISGKKQAGKTTIANIIHGEYLYKNNLVKDYSINKKGKLSVQTSDNSEWGIFDIERKDQEFSEYAHYNLWPWVKLYNFADPVKEMCVNLFGLTHDQVYGVEENKNEKIHLLWENVSTDWPQKTGQMTAREFMQFFGTNIMRKIYPNVWTNACINKILKEGSELSIIADVRFPNEVEAINKAGGKVLRLERSVYDDNHESEVILDSKNYDHSNFWKVLDNRELTIKQTVTEIKSLLEEIK